MLISAAYSVRAAAFGRPDSSSSSSFALSQEQPSRQALALAPHFTPWAADDKRNCWTCARSTGYDGVHLWCKLHRLVVVPPCG
jgi:hypothetical protein